MAWTLDNQFVLSLGLHDGWTTVLFPWDDSPSCTATQDAVTVEDATFYQLALLYAHHHEFMHTGECPCHPELPLILGNYRSMLASVLSSTSSIIILLDTRMLSLLKGEVGIGISSSHLALSSQLRLISSSFLSRVKEMKISTKIT